jgi:hypothetical protein
MLGKMQQKHLSRFILEILSRSISFLSTSSSLYQGKYANIVYYSQHIGPVTASLSPVEENALRKREEEQVAIVEKQKRMRLRSIINITDFEGAASEFMTPESFACSYSPNFQNSEFA